MTDNLPDPHETSGDNSLTLTEHIEVAQDLLADLDDIDDLEEQHYHLATALEHYEEAQRRLDTVTTTLNEAVHYEPYETPQEDL